MSNFVNKNGCDLIGPTGPAGHSIVSAVITTVTVGDPAVNEEHLILTSSSGATFDVGECAGPTGAAGSGFTSATIPADGGDAGKLIITKSDGSTFSAGTALGTAGTNGLSVSNASIDSNSSSDTFGHLILTLSDGATLDAGNAKGTDGTNGADSITVLELKVFS